MEEVFFKFTKYGTKQVNVSVATCSFTINNADISYFDRTQPTWVVAQICGYTNCKITSSDADEFTQHLNSVDPNIQLTTETESNGELAFLATCTVRQDDGSLRIKVYRKPTYTDQYLNWESNHPLEHKISVARTLFHRANTVPSHPEDTSLIVCFHQYSVTFIK